MYFYTFKAVYFFAAHVVTVRADSDVQARAKARGVARKALALVLICVEG